MEGSASILELSAIAMHRETLQIVDVFHAYASGKDYWWPTAHVHGLNPKYLQRYGFSSQEELLTTFKLWLNQKTYTNIYANDSTKESEVLKLKVEDFRLPPWVVRRKLPEHNLKIWYKQNNLPIFKVKCCPQAHSFYEGIKVRPDSERDEALIEHGHHCSLYDAYEVMLHFITNKSNHNAF